MDPFPLLKMKYFVVYIAFAFICLSCRSTTDNDAHDSINDISFFHAPANNASEGDDRIQGYSIDGNAIQEYPDGIYCAEVEYYNPNTGTNSSYTLTIEVEDNEVTRVNFPNGGWLGSEDFSDAELDGQGTVTFTSDKGYDYEIRIIGRGEGCLINVSSAVRCIGLTEHGARCKNMTDNSNQRCWQHQYQDDEDINGDLEDDDTSIENDSDTD